MKKFVNSVFVLCLSFLSFGQVQPQKLHNNLRKLAKIADIEAGKYNKEKENPQRRFELERLMQIDPSTGRIPENIREKELQYVQSQTSRLSKNSSLFGVNVGGASWINRGPWNVGGRTRALAVDVSNENIILAGGVSGGIFRSTDGGATWSNTFSSTQLKSVTSIAQDTRSGFENIWYATTGEPSGNSARARGGNGSFRGNGVYKSTDNGISWSLITSTKTDTPQSYDSRFDFNWRIIVNPTNGDVVVASPWYISKSTDGGSSWTLTEGDVGFYTDIVVSSSGRYYLASGTSGSTSGVLTSTDGSNWTNITPGFMPSTIDRTTIAISPSNENIVYFISNTPSAGTLDHTLMKYNASSGAWTNLSSNIPALGGDVGDFDSQGGYDLVIGVHPSSSNTVYIGGTNLYRSTDGFTTSTNTTWIGGYSPVNNISQYENHHPDIHALVFFPSNPNKMLCGSDGGVSMTTNNLLNQTDDSPVNWVEYNNGYLTTQAYSVAIDESNSNDMIMAGFQDNGTWYNDNNISTANWDEEYSGDGSFCAFAENGLVRYVSSQNGNIFRHVYNSNGNFISWARIKPDIMSNPLFITPFVIDPNNEDIMYLPDGDKILRNTSLSSVPTFDNNLATFGWSALNNTAVGGTVSALDISKSPANILVYGTDDGKVYKATNANGSPTGIEITGSNFPSGAWVSSIKIDPSNADNIYVVFSNYSVPSVFMTNDGGSSWTDISGNLEENSDGSGNGPSVRWFEILDMGGGDVAYFVGTSTGIYATEVLNSSSTNWNQEGASSIGNTVVTMIKTRSDGTVAAATHANGLYTTKFTSTSVTAPEADFNANNLSIQAGNTVDFTDLSTNNPTSWTWTFTGANTTSSSSQNPTGIQYDTPGCYEVTLIATNSGGSDTETKSCYINVTASTGVVCGCDEKTNITSSDTYANYSFQSGNGYVFGQSANGANQFAEKFSSPVEGFLSSMSFYAYTLSDAGAGGYITIHVWDDNSGLPGNSIYSEDVPLSGITPNAYNNITFSNDVSVSYNYYVGYSIYYNGNSDTLTVLSTSDRESGDNSAYIFSGGSWNSTLNLYDIYVALDIEVEFCADIKETVDENLCYGDSYTFADGFILNDITSDESYISTLTSVVYGCDSTVTENITVIQFPTANNISVDSCSVGDVVFNLSNYDNEVGAGTVEWFKDENCNDPQANTFTLNSSSSQTLYTKLSNANLCSDTSEAVFTINSVPSVTLNGPLEINCSNPSVTMDGSGSETTDVDYSWSVVSGGPLTGANNTISTSTTNTGTYRLTVINTTTGCESYDDVVVDELIIDNTVDVNGNTLTANQNAADYQWIDCDNNNAPIANETNQSFNATNGNFAVIVTVNGCSVTSNCELVTILSSTNLEQEQSIQIYPNPTNNKIYIENFSIGKTEYHIYDAKGVLINKVISDEKKVEINLDNYANGVYNLKIINENINTDNAIIKQ